MDPTTGGGSENVHGHFNEDGADEMDVHVDHLDGHDPIVNDNWRPEDFNMEEGNPANFPAPDLDPEHDVPMPGAAVGPDIGNQPPNVEFNANVGPAFPELSRPLFEGATMTQGKMVLAMNNIKTKHKVSNAAMTAIYKVIRAGMPEGNLVPKSNYAARRSLNATGLGFQSIHACPNHCLLYRGEELKDLSHCPKCEEPRFHPNSKSPKKVCPMLVMALYLLVFFCAICPGEYTY